MPHSIEVNNRTITDPKAMNNVFNNYFTTIDKKTNSNIKFSPKHYIDYLSYTNTNTFFLTPIDTNEISFIISKSIPAKILKLLKNFISQHLSEIFTMSFPTGQFSSHCYTFLKSLLYIKNNQKLIIQIMDQYPSYLILKNH